jgi:hypothetical protein
LSAEIDKNGTQLPDGAAGDDVRRAIGIMDRPIVTALKEGGATEALELW